MTTSPSTGPALLLACHSDSKDFPGAPRTGGGMDAYVVKIDPRAGRILWTVRLGGSDYDGAFRIKVDDGGNAYAVGLTQSPDFPTTPAALQPGYGGGDGDGFLVKLGPDGRLLYSTYLGGSGSDQAMDVVAGARLYVAGMTGSSRFPGIRDPRPHGREDGLCSDSIPPGPARLSRHSSAPVWPTAPAPSNSTAGDISTWPAIRKRRVSASARPEPGGKAVTPMRFC